MPNLNKKTIGGAILGVLVLLLFFSKTIYAHNLPEVSAVLPKNGRLSKQERTTGVASWAETEKLYAELDGTVEEVLVQEGDKVRKGQELLRLGFDRDDAERKLRELQNQRSGLYLDIQEINLRLNKAQRQKEDLAGEEIEEEEITDYDLTKLNMDIRVARLELQEAREQHDYGDISDADLERARLKLQGLYVDLEKLGHELEEKEKQAKKDLEKDEKEKDSGLKDSDDSIASANLDLKAKNLALEKVALDEEPLKKALEDFETYAVITAPADGTITTLDVSKGDGGSQFLGYMLGALPLLKSPLVLRFNLFPMVVVLSSIPLLDTVAAIWRRTREGRSFFTPDKRHLHHKLMEMGYTTKSVLPLLVTIQTGLCGVSFLAVVGIAGVRGFIVLGVGLGVMILFFAIIHYTSHAVSRVKGKTSPEDPK